MAWNTSMGLATRLKTPQRTQGIVAAAAKRREGGRSEADHTLNQLRGQLAQAKKHVRNLLDALADGLAGESDLFKEKLSQAESERAELTNLIEAQEAQIKDALKPISIEEAKVASANLKRLIEAAPADLKKRYVRAFVSEIVVGKSEIVISWPKDALAEAVTGTPPAHIAAASGPVRSLVRKWRAGAGETGNWAAVRTRALKTA